MDCIEKAYQSILENPMFKKYGYLWRTNENIHDILHQIDLISSNEKHNWQIRQFVVHADMTTTKRGTFLEKTPQTVFSWWNQFWKTSAKFSVTLLTRKLQNKNLTQIWKRLIPTNFTVKFAKTSKKKIEVYPISFVYIWTIIEGIVQDLCAPLQVFNFFLVSVGQKNSSGTRRATNDHVT